MISFPVVIVAVCFFLFILIDLDNVLRYHTGFSLESKRPEIEKSIAFPLLLAGIGTAAFFLESFLYVLIGFTNNLITLPAYLEIRTTMLEFLGLLVMILGYAIFLWSVLARGRYATSWQMPADHKLVDWGPYRYIRHPSYLGYFLMFIGFLLLWHNTLALVPLIAIPGYVLITFREEEMLVAKFRDEYLRYQKHTGRFLPKIDLL
jgi:protein-S-isoprenylcysteine O-methyltransferase Ste14